MHQSSYRRMSEFCRRYLGDLSASPDSADGAKRLVVDFGSQDINGSFKPLFDPARWDYLGIDLADGKNVDMVLADPYHWGGIATNSVDCVVSGQAFEHTEYFWLSMGEIARVLKPGGYCCIIAPSAGPEHRHPVDCWRIYADGMAALARYTHLECLQASTAWEPAPEDDEEARIWRDTVLIARKTASGMALSSGATAAAREWKPRKFGLDAWSGHVPFGYDLVAELKPRVVVELGVHRGESYFAFCQSAQENATGSVCHAVDTWQGDPQAGYYGEEVFEEVRRHNEEHYAAFSHLLRMTFDEALGRFEDASIDLLHIDGLHTYEVVRHDFEAWLPKMRSGGIVLIHDIAARHGDFGVWKLWESLETPGRSFAFQHAWGLGVLRVGAEGEPLPDSPLLRQLFAPDQAENHEALRRHYEIAADSFGLRFNPENELVRLRSDFNLLNADRAKAQAIITEQAAEVTDLRGSMARLREDRTKAQRILDEQAAEVTDLRGSMERLRDDRTKAQRILDEQAAEVTDLRGSMERLQEDRAKAQAIINEQAAEVTDLRGSMERLRDDRAKAQAIINEQAAEVADLRGSMERLREDRAKAQAIMDEQSAELAERKGAFAALLEDRGKAQEIMDHQAAELARLRAADQVSPS